MRRVHLLLPILLAACAPQNASIEEGDFTVFLSATNSPTVDKGKLDIAGFGDTEGFQRLPAIDCRTFETATSDKETNALRLADRAQICPGDADPSPLWPPDHETWLADSGYHVLGGKLDPWRGEAIITSEGDVQIGFHQRLPGGEDFRFAFVVDPNFQPTQCVQDPETGDVTQEPIDGDWVGQWSKDLSGDSAGGTLYMLNAGGFQFDPRDPKSQWFLPDQWEAGYGAGRFADDGFTSRATLFGDPSTYLNPIDEVSGQVNVLASDLLWCPPDGNEYPYPVSRPLYNNQAECMEGTVERAEEIADAAAKELEAFGIAKPSGKLPAVRPRVHGNQWRESDGKAAGYDGWVELNYSWVEFDKDSDLSVGGAASGTFNLMFDAGDSTSRFYVRGRFSVDRFKKDTWSTAYLPGIKMEENQTIVCGKPYTPPAE